QCETSCVIHSHRAAQAPRGNLCQSVQGRVPPAPTPGGKRRAWDRLNTGSTAERVQYGRIPTSPAIRVTTDFSENRRHPSVPGPSPSPPAPFHLCSSAPLLPPAPFPSPQLRHFQIF